MKLLRLSAASIFLIGFSAADADAQERTDFSNMQEAESEVEPGWAGAIELGTSTIMAQANTVFAALRGDEAASEGPETVQVANLDPETAEIPDGNGSQGCIFMPTPGSRIRRERCYYPNEGEQALNEYQFDQEIRQMRLQSEVARMEALRQMENAASGR